MRDRCYKNEELGAGNAKMKNGNKTYLEQLEMYLHSAELNVVAVTENVNTFLLV